MLLACADALTAVGMEPVVVAPHRPLARALGGPVRGPRHRRGARPPKDPWWRAARATRRAVAGVRRGCRRSARVVPQVCVPVGGHGWGAGTHRAAPLAARRADAGAGRRGRRRPGRRVPSESTRGFLPATWPVTPTSSATGARTPPRSRDRGGDDGAPAAEPLRRHPPLVVSGPGSRRWWGTWGRVAPEKGLVDLVKAVELLDEQGVARGRWCAWVGEALFISEEQAEELSRAMARLGPGCTGRAGCSA
ncbi:hypothetical protein QJS66_07595 [Kocuria rhizophila]|nr:hypothetical protein QJS66_07595 [Kocuria rhizophila]